MRRAAGFYTDIHGPQRIELELLSDMRRSPDIFLYFCGLCESPDVAPDIFLELFWLGTISCCVFFMCKRQTLHVHIQCSGRFAEFISENGFGDPLTFTSALSGLDCLELWFRHPHCLRLNLKNPQMCPCWIKITNIVRYPRQQHVSLLAFDLKQLQPHRAASMATDSSLMFLLPHWAAAIYHVLNDLSSPVAFGLALHPQDSKKEPDKREATAEQNKTCLEIH